MSVTNNEYVQLAAKPYQSAVANVLTLPVGWNLLEPFNEIPDSFFGWGFSAGVYKKGNEVVISYTGTNDRSLDWLVGNGPAFAGTYSSQVFQAMKLYLDVKRSNPSAHITITGHSLGGGLAALMGVFFDQTAIGFDAAPISYQR